MNQLVKDKIIKIKTGIMKKENEVKEIKTEYKKYLLILIALISDYYNRDVYNGKISNFKKSIIMNDLEKKIREFSDELYNFQYDFIINELKDIYEETYFKNIEILNEAKNMDIKEELIPEEVDEIINSNYQGCSISSKLKENINEFSETIYNKINRNILNRKTLDEMITDISKTFEVATYEGKELLSTEQTRIFTEAQEKVFRDFEIQEIMWSSHACFKPCMYCEAMNGKVFRMDDRNKPTIPAHSSCNCCWIPVVSFI